jgi:hypothetical protein
MGLLPAPPPPPTPPQIAFYEGIRGGNTGLIYWGQNAWNVGTGKIIQHYDNIGVLLNEQSNNMIVFPKIDPATSCFQIDLGWYSPTNHTFWAPAAFTAFQNNFCRAEVWDTGSTGTLLNPDATQSGLLVNTGGSSLGTSGVGTNNATVHMSGLLIAVPADANTSLNLATKWSNDFPISQMYGVDGTTFQVRISIVPRLVGYQPYMATVA